MAYTTRRMTAVPLEIAATPVSETLPEPRVEWNAAGMSSEEIERARSEQAVCAVYVRRVVREVRSC